MEKHFKVEERAEVQRREAAQLQGLGAEMVLGVGCYSSNLKVTSMGKYEGWPQKRNLGFTVCFQGLLMATLEDI